MCHSDTADTAVRVVCGDRAQEQRLDCGNDDYFHTDPKPGSYLATHWNLADSAYLIDASAGRAPAGGSQAGGTAGQRPAGGAPGAATRWPATRRTPPPVRHRRTASRPRRRPREPAPRRTRPSRPSPPVSPARPSHRQRIRPPRTRPAPRPRPSRPPARRPRRRRPTPTARPRTAPEPAEPEPAAGKLAISDVSSTSVRLAWPKAGRGTRYAVVVNGRTLGGTTATRIRVIGLRPLTAYQMQVTIAGAAAPAHTATVTVRTPAAIRPVSGRAFQLGNALTGGAAHLYGSRMADGTPLVLGPRDGAADQQWQLEELGDGRHLLRSRATGKCVAPLGATVAGAVLVQRACAPGDPAQQWRIIVSPHGFTFTSAQVPLVMGVSRLRYGGQRLLVLQRADAARYQSWSASPA